MRAENSVLTVSSLVQGKYGLADVCLSLPSVISRNGITRILELPLDEWERRALKNSADVIRKAIASVTPA